jgi:peptidoglycan-N-acetylglucosamine deacetylase
MVSACVSVEMDGISFWSDGLGMRSPSDCSRGEFERVAVPRVLDTLAEFGVKATWFIPGVTVQTFPSEAEAVLEAGHELAHHGWRHRWHHDSDSDLRSDFELGVEALTKCTGHAPHGYRAPGGGLTAHGIDLLIEYGFEWESSLSGNDSQAYWLRRGDRLQPDGTYLWGTDTSVLEVPCSWNLDDGPAFEFIWDTNAGLRAPSDVLESWLGEFEYLHEHVSDALYAPVFHSQVIGRGHRLTVLRGLLERLASAGDVEFLTFSEYAKHWKSAHAEL